MVTAIDSFPVCLHSQADCPRQQLLTNQCYIFLTLAERFCTTIIILLFVSTIQWVFSLHKYSVHCHLTQLCPLLLNFTLPFPSCRISWSGLLNVMSWKLKWTKRVMKWMRVRIAFSMQHTSKGPLWTHYCVCVDVSVYKFMSEFL